MWGCVKSFRALRSLFISVLGAGSGCCFFILGAGIGLYGGTGLASKYCINCRTFFLGVGIEVLFHGAGIERLASSRILLGAGIGRLASFIHSIYFAINQKYNNSIQEYIKDITIFN